jgi:ribosomal protein S18 acetylase RimI-like enzyme
MNLKPEIPIQLHRLHSAEDPAFHDLLRIYTASLPASERKPPEQLAAMLTRPEYLFLINSVNTAFAIAICLDQTEAALLEYLAVDPAHRSRGAGSHLFTALTQRPELTNRTLIAEVDVPTDPTAARRKSFYRKLGCREIAHLTYLMPQVAETPPPPMHLLLYKHEPQTTIPKPQLQTWLECIYTEVYAQPIPNPRIDAMLTPLPDPIPLLP